MLGNEHWWPLDLDADHRRLVDDRDPEFARLAAACARALEPCMRMAVRHSPHHVVSVVVTQCVNDWLDLLRDLNAGRGRPALRCARGMVEHVANLLDLTGSDAAANTARFESHEDVVGPITTQEARHLLGIDEMPHEMALAYMRYYNRAERRKQRAQANALATYGKQFKSRWHAVDLRQRLASQGLQSFYDFYQYSSAILHGGPSGQHGLVEAFSPDEPYVHRTGPALVLCPIAYRHGLHAFSTFCTHLTWVKHDLRQGVEVSLRDLQAHWPEYLQALYSLDQQTWPDDRPMLTPVVVVGRFRTPQWWLHDTERDLIVKAEPVAQDLGSRLQTLTSDLAEKHPLYREGREVTIALTVGDVQPIAGEPWRDASVLPPREGRI